MRALELERLVYVADAIEHAAPSTCAVGEDCVNDVAQLQLEGVVRGVAVKAPVGGRESESVLVHETGEWLAALVAARRGSAEDGGQRRGERVVVQGVE